MTPARDPETARTSVRYTDINFGDLEYGSDDINELSVKLRYDWANCTTPTSGGSAGSSAESGKGGNGPFFSSTTA